MNQYAKGLGITLTGVLLLSPDSLLMRLVELDALTIVFYRGVFLFLWVNIILVFFYKKKILIQFTSLQKPDFLLAVLHALGTFCFVLAVIYTTIAKALIIVSIAPIISAVLSYFFLSEKISISTLLAIVITFLGFGIIFSDDITWNGSWFGNINAIIATFAFSSTFVLSRHKPRQVMPALFISSLLLIATSLCFFPSLRISFFSLAIFFFLGFVLASSFYFLILGLKYISATEVSILTLLETIIAIALAWLFLQEIPNYKTIFGGILILLAIAINAYYQTKSTKKKKEKSYLLEK